MALKIQRRLDWLLILKNKKAAGWFAPDLVLLGALLLDLPV